MKIAIPLDENRQDISIVLARTPYFLMSEDGREEILKNPAADANGGAGTQAAQFLADQEIDVLITVRCGQNAAAVLEEADVKIFKSVHKTAKENLDAFHEGKLQELTEFHGGFHGIK